MNFHRNIQLETEHLKSLKIIIHYQSFRYNFRDTLLKMKDFKNDKRGICRCIEDSLESDPLYYHTSSAVQSRTREKLCSRVTSHLS